MGSSRLRDAPSDQAVRDALVALCPDAASLAAQFNRRFAAQLPKAVKHRRWRLAIALHLRPYHGQPHGRPAEIYRRQAKIGEACLRTSTPNPTLRLLFVGIALVLRRLGVDTLVVLSNAAARRAPPESAHAALSNPPDVVNPSGRGGFRHQ